MRFSLPSIKCSEGPTSFDYCRTLFVVWTVHNNSIYTVRSAAVKSWEEPASIWLTVAKNAFVGWALNFRVRMLLKGAVNCRYLISYQIKPYKTRWLSVCTKNYEKNELSNFSLLLNASARITFWTLHVKANFVFHLFMCSSISRAKALKKCVRDLPCIQLQWKVTDWTFSK